MMMIVLLLPLPSPSSPPRIPRLAPPSQSPFLRPPRPATHFFHPAPNNLLSEPWPPIRCHRLIPRPPLLRHNLLQKPAAYILSCNLWRRGYCGVCPTRASAEACTRTRNLSALTHTQAICIGLVAYGLLIVCNGVTACGDVKYADVETAPILVGILTFAMEGIYVLPSVYDGMRDPRKFGLVLDLAYSTATAICVMFGMCVYYIWGPETASVVATNLHR